MMPMGVGGIAMWYIQSIYAENEDFSFTHDIEFAPSSIGATGFGNYLMVSGSPNYYYIGVSEYRTRDPETGVDTVHTFGTSYGTVAPAFFDNNVDSVTYAIGLGNSNWVWINVTMQLFFFD